ncbi:hypothetical protein [Angustibacter luteus]|uniref:Uncharacterized protein n=1 Tax=Angustibacter luteus TaxID=658456 RepID=A0ABW1JAV2_9ACTN
MTRQTAVTVRATLADGAVGDTIALLREIRAAGGGDSMLPFGSLYGVHFARVFVLEEVEDLEGRTIAPSLVYMCDVDTDEPAHLLELATVAGPGLDALFGRCLGYPAHPSVQGRVAWLTEHSLRPAAVYVHTIGRTLRQVLDEAALSAALADEVDGLPANVRAGADARSLHARLRDAVTDRADLGWARHPASRAGSPSKLRSLVVLVALGLVALVLLPLLVVVLVVFLLLLRVHELRDVPETGPVDLDHVHDVEQYEDWATQNPFTAVGFVKPGFVRATTMRVALLGLDLGNRLVFNSHTLAGVTSLHFARWVPLDGGRRLVFASSYDGSQESYMNDFIDRLAWGLNLVFSNGVGYPSTRWLLFGGARDETAFKRYLRRHQVPTVVWYSAYPELHAPRIDRNAALRRGLAGHPDQPQAAEWLALL